MKHIFKTLIEDNIIDFQALVLTYYHHFGLNEQEAVTLIKLNDLIKDNQQLLKPAKFAKMMSLSTKQTENILTNLIDKGFLSIKLTENTKGKSQEIFDIDFFLIKVIHYLQKHLDKHYESATRAWVDFLEDSLQRPLSQLDIELVTKWIEEEQYSLEMVKEATIETLKMKNPSLRHIDRKLLEQLETIKKRPEKKEVLKDFYKLWDE